MKKQLGGFAGIIIASFGLAASGAPPATAVVPPPGGVISPGPVGGQLAPQGVGGTFQPGSILTAPPLADLRVNNGIPGGSLYIGSNGAFANPSIKTPPGGTLTNSGVGGVSPNVIVAGGSATAASGGSPSASSGGTVTPNGIGGSSGSVIVSGGTTTGGAVNNGGTGGVIVSGGSSH